MSKQWQIERSVVADLEGGFIAHGPGADIDEAFDAAVTLERFELGSSGVIPSIVDIDPAAPREVLDGVHHPFAATDALLSRVSGCERGTIVAVAVAPLSAYKTVKTRLVLEGTDLVLPETPGLLLPLHATVRAKVEDLVPEPQGTLVGVELTAPPRRRFKAAAERVTGPRSAGYALIEGGIVLSVHPNASEARKAGLLLARGEGGARELEIRPWIGRNENDPYLRVRRAMIAQKAVVKALHATEKNPDRTRIAGWIFAGRTPAGN